MYKNKSFLTLLSLQSKSLSIFLFTYIPPLLHCRVSAMSSPRPISPMLIESTTFTPKDDSYMSHAAGTDSPTTFSHFASPPPPPCPPLPSHPLPECICVDGDCDCASCEHCTPDLRCTLGR